MKWIGLTGGIASGKSTVAKIISQMGFPVLDADEVARYVVKKGSPGMEQVVLHFGSQVLGADGELDRKAIAQIVFSNREKLFELEGILHPLIRCEVLARKTNLEKQNMTIAFYDVPLLFEKNMQKDFDEIILVTSTKSLQVSRMKSRDGFSRAEAEARLENQIPLSEKEAQATRVISNNGTLKDLETATRSIIQSLIVS